MKRAATDKERVKKLIDKGAPFSTSGIFLHTSNMIITSDDIIQAQQHHLESIERKKQKKADKENEEKLQTCQKASQAVAKFKTLPLDKISTKMLSSPID